jgi:hypothetical protein
MIHRLTERLQSLKAELAKIELETPLDTEPEPREEENELIPEEEEPNEEPRTIEPKQQEKEKPIAEKRETGTDTSKKITEAMETGTGAVKKPLVIRDYREIKGAMEKESEEPPPGYYRSKKGYLVKQLPRNEDNELIFPHQIQLPRLHAAALNKNGTKYNALFATLYKFIERLHASVQTRTGLGKRDRTGESLRVRTQPSIARYWRMDPKDPQLDCTVSISVPTFTDDVDRYVTPLAYEALREVISVIKRHARGVGAIDNAVMYDFICSSSLSVPFMHLVTSYLTLGQKRNATRIDAARDSAQETRDIQTFIRSSYIKRRNGPLEFHQIV